MKRILTLALGASLLAGIAMGAANAQGAASGPFADVPTDHWAYSSVEKLRDAGIVIGYPDGTYGGHRPMTRYEFAEAIARLLPLINKITVPNPQNNTDLTNYYTKSEVDSALANKASTASVDQLRSDLTAKLQANSEALDNLTKLVNQFQPELQQLGVDVASVKAQLKGILDRLDAVEREQARVKITGDVNIIGRSDIKMTNRTAVNGNNATVYDEDGNPLGNPAGKNDIFAQPQVYNDILLNIVGRVSDSTQAVVRMDIGNYANYIGSETASVGHLPYGQAAATSYNLYEAYLQSPVSLGPLKGSSITVGRFGEQFTELTYKAVNPDSYVNLEQTESGNVIGDGLGVRFGAGQFKVYAFATKTDSTAQPLSPYTLGGGSTSLPTGGRQFGPTWTGAFDETAGARVIVGSSKNFSIGVTGVVARFSPDSQGTDPNKGRAINNLGVYGADIQGGIPTGSSRLANVTYRAEGAISPTGTNGNLGNVNDNKGNEAFKANVGFSFNALDVKVGYQAIYANFQSPGYWEHLGAWVNPTNIEGPNLKAYLSLNHVISVFGEGDYYQGVDQSSFTPLRSSHDKLGRIAAGVKFALNSGYSADIGYEWLQYNLQNAVGNPTESYLNFGIAHTINPNASVKVLYQIANYNNDGTSFDSTASTNGNNTGGVALTQLDVKF